MVETPPTLDPVVITLDGTTFTADAHGRFTIDDQTLAPGGNITVGAARSTVANGHTSLVGGTRLSLESAGLLDPSSFRLIISETSTITLYTPTSTTSPVALATVSVAGQLYRVLEDGRIITGSKTIPPGSFDNIDRVFTETLLNGTTATMSLIIVSLNPVNGVVVVDGATIPITAAGMYDYPIPGGTMQTQDSLGGDEVGGEMPPSGATNSTEVTSRGGRRFGIFGRMIIPFCAGAVSLCLC